MTIGEKIKTLRKSKGISRAELAHRTGLASQSIFRYETGDTEKISITAVEKIAEALGVLPAEIVGWHLPNDFTAVPVHLNKIGNDIDPLPEEVCEIGVPWENPVTAVRIDVPPLFPELMKGDIVIRHTA